MHSIRPFLLLSALVFTSVASEGQMACRQVLTKQASDALFSTQHLQGKFSQIRDAFEWSNSTDLTVDYLRLVPSVDFFRAQNRGVFREDIYGREVFRDWANANQRLNDIPVGRLQLSLSLFQEVHTISTKNVTPFLKKISHLLPPGLVPDAGGVFKNRNSVGRDPMLHPISEAIYKNLKDNPWLGGFVEAPYPISRPGKRRGFLLYARASDTPAKLKELIDWYEANKATMDPIDLAADFQRAFVSIHPFVDGNGRTSRLFMDRILREHGLPPPLLPTHNNDVYMSQKEYRAYIRRGIERFHRVWAKTTQYSGRNVPTDGAAMVTSAQGIARIRDNSPGSAREKLHEMVTNDRTLETLIYKIGGQDFRYSFGNGFFYNTNGIPHLLHDGRLFPISDRSLWVYASAAPEVRDHVYQRGLELILAIAAKDPTLQDLRIEPYAPIQKANKSGELFLYEWQKPLLESVLDVKMDSPERILSRRSTGKTYFEYNQQNGEKKFTFNEILAQYEYLDIEYREYQKFTEKNFPDLVSRAIEARRRIHWAARKLMQPQLDRIAKLSTEDRALLEKENFYQVYQTYFQGSKLKYRNYDSAIQDMGDSHITLLRADNDMAHWVGFRSKNDWNDIARSMPYYSYAHKLARDLHSSLGKPEYVKTLTEKLEKYKAQIDKFIVYLPDSLQAHLKKSPAEVISSFQYALKAILGVLKDPAKHKSVADQVDRAVIDLAMHAGGAIPVKVGTSFSTSLGLYSLAVHGASGISFGGDASMARLFVVRAPYEKFLWNTGTSSYHSEYEIVSMKPVSRREIIKSFTGAQLEPVKSRDTLSESLQEVLRNY